MVDRSKSSLCGQHKKKGSLKWFTVDRWPPFVITFPLRVCHIIYGYSENNLQGTTWNPFKEPGSSQTKCKWLIYHSFSKIRKGRQRTWSLAKYSLRWLGSLFTSGRQNSGCESTNTLPAQSFSSWEEEKKMFILELFATDEIIIYLHFTGVENNKNKLKFRYSV